MFERGFQLIKSVYESIDEEEAYEITLIIYVVGSVVAMFFVVGFCISCFTKHTKGEKKLLYQPSTLYKSVEDNIYFSEISPSSSINLLSNGTSLFSNPGTALSIVSEENSKNWLSLPLAIRRRFTQKSKTEIPTTAHLYIKYVTSDGPMNTCGKLHISIRDIVSLPTKDYPRYTEAYLIIKLVRSQRNLKGCTETIICENRTRNFRNTRDIKVDEYFMVDTKKNDWKNWNLVLTAFDEDMYTKPTELASAVTPLSRKYKEIISNSEGIELTCQLKSVPKNLGNVLVGLSYLPTSQRLSVNIAKAANLPPTKEIHAKMYAQLFLLTGITGRSLKRKKLMLTPSFYDPYEFNMTLSFDITPNLLETVTLLIILYREIHDPDKINIGATNPDTDAAVKKTNDHCYGSVAIGKMVSSQKGKKHWNMMTMAPRRVVTVWHSLK